MSTRTLISLQEVLSALSKSKIVRQSITGDSRQVKSKLQSQYIPYASSKLTLHLRDYLQPKHSKIIMLAHVSSSQEHVRDTVNTLSYVKRIREDSMD